MADQTVDTVLERVSELVVSTLQDEVTPALQEAVRSLAAVDWGGAAFLEVVIDDMSFAMTVAGRTVRVSGAEAFQDPTTEPRPLLAHPAMAKLIAATEAALQAVDPAPRQQLESDVWFGVVGKVAAWLAAHWFWVEGRPDLPVLFSIKDAPPSYAVFDVRLRLWTTRFDFLANLAARP